MLSPSVWEAWIETSVAQGFEMLYTSRLPFGRRGLKPYFGRIVVAAAVASRLGDMD